MVHPARIPKGDRPAKAVADQTQKECPWTLVDVLDLEMYDWNELGAKGIVFGREEAK